MQRCVFLSLFLSLWSQRHRRHRHSATWRSIFTRSSLPSLVSHLLSVVCLRHSLDSQSVASRQSLATGGMFLVSSPLAACHVMAVRKLSEFDMPSQAEDTGRRDPSSSSSSYSPYPMPSVFIVEFFYCSRQSAVLINSGAF